MPRRRSYYRRGRSLSGNSAGADIDEGAEPLPAEAVAIYQVSFKFIIY